MGLQKPSNKSYQSKTSKPPTIWISEYHTPNDVYYHGVNEILYQARTQYQAVTIADLGAYGRGLILDGVCQTTEGDEPFYHEPIVHLPCLIHGKPESVLILGGADGGSAREALRWRSVESVFVVDIDGDVVDACRKYLPSISRGAFEDPRCKLIIKDALDFIENTEQQFDVIIGDLTDPEKNSPSLALFTKQFFSNLKRCLKPLGTFSVMSGTASLAENSKCYPRICKTLASVFKSVRPSQVFVPTYGAPVGIAIATDRLQPLVTPQELDEKISESIDGSMHVLDGNSVHGHFAVPRCLKKAIEEEAQEITPENVAFLIE
ncbi:Polyamine aminopropyltransferase [Gracilariopsis chorda]|uniref:thermospermine synthase n=1 Tax=Gracilariopsis chorda TaxID=448386 RepID=A0A2V3J4Q3_9FLOR|nr:Polyamine aminopropyltransferase [Gracilariopsis chorda]|eukprot:PXF49431.1 Polyamine aminopropyltransferase [Gracilariopsis chorda]